MVIAHIRSIKSGYMVPGLAFILILGFLAGCESNEASLVANKATNDAADQSISTVSDLSDFNANIELCRKVGKKSGRRIGKSEHFKITAKSAVYGFVDFENVQLDRPYSVHLVWVKPDGKDLYSRYAEVVQTKAADSDTFTTTIAWKKAENLTEQKLTTEISTEQSFTLSSRLNISTKKQRQIGEYHFMVYLDRRHFLDQVFTVE